jgi:Flp pilus assembly protein TadB
MWGRVPLTFIAIVLLAAAWAALLLPDLRGRGLPTRRSNSIDSFSRQLSTIERTRPGQRPSAQVVAFPHRPGITAARPEPARAGVAPRSRSHARLRRQRVLFALAGLVVITFVGGVAISPLLFVVHLAADAALGGFVWLRVEHRRRTLETGVRGQTTHVERSSARPLRRTGSAG